MTMRKAGSWLTGLLWVTAALLLPMAVLASVAVASVQAATGALGSAACDDGSAHLVMGCASILL